MFTLVSLIHEKWIRTVQAIFLTAIQQHFCFLPDNNLACEFSHLQVSFTEKKKHFNSTKNLAKEFAFS